MAFRKKPIDEDGTPFEQPFPGYEINARLGETGLTATWRAWDLRFDREVVLRELHPRLDDAEATVEEFFATVRSVARLRHPRLVRALDTGRSGERFFVVFQSIRGESAASRLAAGKTFSEKRVLHTAQAVAEALEYLYELGVVHGDIKPENILFAQDNAVWLDGLGLPVDTLYASPQERCRCEPAWAAPEQFDEDAYPESGTDLYALGCVLYHMVTGRPPYAGESREAVVEQHCDPDALPEPPRAVQPRLAAATSSLIMALLATEADQRLRQPQALLERLAAHPLLVAEREAEAASAAAAAAAAAQQAAAADEPSEEDDDLLAAAAQTLGTAQDMPE